MINIFVTAITLFVIISHLLNVMAAQGNSLVKQKSYNTIINSRIKFK